MNGQLDVRRYNGTEGHMTDRLEKALRQLAPEELEHLADVAESIVRAHSSTQQGSPGEPMKLEWARSMKNGPYRSGLEAQEAAKHYRIFLLQRGMPKQ